MHREFNAILHSLKKLSKQPYQMSQVDSFDDALDNCQLEDLGFQGYLYTWNNKRPGDANTKVQLDLAVATKEWREKFQLSKIIYLSSHASNHLPILLQTQSNRNQRSFGSRGFKFE